MRFELNIIANYLLGTVWTVNDVLGKISLFRVVHKKSYTSCQTIKQYVFPKKVHILLDVIDGPTCMYQLVKNKNVNLGTKRRPSSRQVALTIVWLSLSTLSPNPTPPAERIETMASLAGLGSGTN